MNRPLGIQGIASQRLIILHSVLEKRRYHGMMWLPSVVCISSLAYKSLYWCFSLKVCLLPHNYTCNSDHFSLSTNKVFSMVDEWVKTFPQYYHCHLGYLPFYPALTYCLASLQFLLKTHILPYYVTCKPSLIWKSQILFTAVLRFMPHLYQCWCPCMDYTIKSHFLSSLGKQ